MRFFSEQNIYVKLKLEMLVQAKPPNVWWHFEPESLCSSVTSKENNWKKAHIQTTNAQKKYYICIFFICHFSFWKTKVWSQSVGNFTIKGPI